MKREFRDKDDYFIGSTGNSPQLHIPMPEQIETEIYDHWEVDTSKQIFVKSNLHQFDDGGDPLAFSENNASHPQGQAFVAGSKPVCVALTEKVAEALTNGQIVKCSPEEMNNFEAARIEGKRRFIASEKEKHKKEFVAMFGTDKGFEEAWQVREKLIGLQIAMKGRP